MNNAGVVTGKSLLECSDEYIQRTFDVNIMAHFWVIILFFKLDLIKSELDSMFDFYVDRQPKVSFLI